MCYRFLLWKEEDTHMSETTSGKVQIELTMYGVAEILKWCVDKNNGRIPNVDT